MSVSPLDQAEAIQRDDLVRNEMLEHDRSNLEDARRNNEAIGFNDLNSFQQSIASLFMFFVQFLGGQGFEGFDNLTGAIMGFDSPEDTAAWRSQMEENGWNWRETQDFNNFDFDAASALNGSLLDLISEHESNGNYNVVYGGKEIDLTHMTVDEVLQWQTNFVRAGSPSSAAGRYQIIHDTLDGLKKEMGLTGKETFSEDMQDRMATVLLNRRGYDDYLAGNISEAKFMNNLSKEWASLPKDMNGRSYYAGDGLNKALTSPESVITAMRSERQRLTEPAPNETTEGMSVAANVGNGLVAPVSLASAYAAAGQATEPLQVAASTPAPSNPASDNDTHKTSTYSAAALV